MINQFFQREEFLRKTSCWYRQFLIYMAEEFDDEDNEFERWCVDGQKIAEASVTILLERDFDFFLREDRLRRRRVEHERAMEAVRLFHVERRARNERRNLPAPAG